MLFMAEMEVRLPPDMPADRPAEIVNFLDLADDLVVSPPEIRDGRAATSGAAGIGIEIDEERLQRYRVDREA